jgi:hypothetical protein
MSVPEGRVIRDPEDELGIMLDNHYYGNAYVREPIPEWWGCLNHLIADAVAKPITDDDRRILRGEFG